MEVRTMPVRAAQVRTTRRPSVPALVRLLAVCMTAGALLAGAGAARAQQNPDAEVLAQLKKAGADLRKPHPMEFFLVVPGQAGAVRVVSKLTIQGYAAESRQVGKNGEWVIRATRTMVPSEPELVAVRKQLNQIAGAERGQYDGWGTEPVR